MIALTAAQVKAVSDAYTTLRAICATRDPKETNLVGLCAESERQLVEAFPHIAVLELVLDAEPQQ